MSRQSRIDELKRNRGPKGESTAENIGYWSRRAERNSTADDAPPKKPGPVEPSRPGGGDDYRRKAKGDLNSDRDVNFMPGVRRNA